MVGIMEGIPQRKGTFLGHDHDLADHFPRFPQGDGHHAVGLIGQHIVLPLPDQLPDLVPGPLLSPLIPGTAKIVAVIKHHRFVPFLYGAQKQPLGLQKDHASFSSSLEISFNWLRMGANFL